jgi:hypothetical protein
MNMQSGTKGMMTGYDVQAKLSKLILQVKHAPALISGQLHASV